MKLIPMTAQELAAYREHTIAHFASEKANSEGIDIERAREAAEDSWKRANPEENDDHVVGHLHANGEVVGMMWFAARPEWGQPCLWLYDIMLDAEHRGKGLGRKAMALFEEEARRRNVNSIGLHVFGHNTIARELYTKLGFRETSIVMRKDLQKTET